MSFDVVVDGCRWRLLRCVVLVVVVCCRVCGLSFVDVVTFCVVGVFGCLMSCCVLVFVVCCLMLLEVCCCDVLLVVVVSCVLLLLAGLLAAYVSCGD